MIYRGRNLPDQFAFVTSDLAPRVEEFRQVVAAGETAALDLQINIKTTVSGRAQNAAYKNFPVMSLREYFFFHCGLVKEMVNQQKKLNVQVVSNGNVQSVEAFFIGNSPEKKADLYLGLYHQEKTYPNHVELIDGKTYIFSNNPYLIKYTPTQAVAQRRQDDLAGFAGSVVFDDKKSNLLDKPDVGIPELREHFHRRSGLYVVAVPYIVLAEAVRGETRARVPKLGMSWSILHWHVLSSRQIVSVPDEGTLEIPALETPSHQSVA